MKIGRWLRRLTDKIRRLLARSPEPPRRIAEEVVLFRVYYPDATPEQWEEFATKLAENAHRAGFARGYGWARRGWTLAAETPEQLLEQQQAAGSLGDGNPYAARLLVEKSDPHDPLRGVSAPDKAAFFSLLESRPFYVDRSPEDD